MSTIAPFDDLALPPFPVRRFTGEEYRRLGEAGVLAEEDRVELLEGWIVPKRIHPPPHDAAVELAQAALHGRLPAGYRVRIQSAISTPDSEPEPDLAVPLWLTLELCVPLRLEESYRATCKSLRISA